MASGPSISNTVIGTTSSGSILTEGMYLGLPSFIQNTMDTELMIAAHDLKSTLASNPKPDYKELLNKVTLEALRSMFVGGMNLDDMAYLADYCLCNGVYLPPPNTMRPDINDPSMGALWSKSIVGAGIHSARSDMTNKVFYLVRTVIDPKSPDAAAMEAAKGNGYLAWYLINRRKNPQLKDDTVATSIPTQGQYQSIPAYVKTMTLYHEEEEARGRRHSAFEQYQQTVRNLNSRYSKTVLHECDLLFSHRHDKQEEIPFTLTFSQIAHTIEQILKEKSIPLPKGGASTQRWYRGKPPSMSPRDSALHAIATSRDDDTFVHAVGCVDLNDPCTFCHQKHIPEDKRHTIGQCYGLRRAILTSDFFQL